MRPVEEEEDLKEVAVYLPHHAVVREDKVTTKVRVVFNASSKNTNGVSLNDTLMVGPKLQPDLRHLVLKWRIHPIVLVADVIKMYRMVLVADKDVKYQRIVWRDDSEKEIQDFELMTVTFGTASAPYLAVKVLNQISIDEGHDFPLAAPQVPHIFFMDDMMGGSNNIEEGFQLYTQMKQLMARAGFKLQKWDTNSKELLKIIQSKEKAEQFENKENQDNIKDKQVQKDKKDNIKDKQNYTKDKQDNIKDNQDKMKDNYKDKGHGSQDKLIQQEKDIQNLRTLPDMGKIDKKETSTGKEIDLKMDNTTKILGLTWDRQEDHFQYSVSLPTTPTGPETKRTILSVIARLYDPLGWIAPAIILAKIFIQKLWLAGSDWDEPISSELRTEWQTYHRELAQLTAVRVPRWLNTGSADCKMELHGFCDASKSAYAAVLYVRTVDSTGEIKVSLLTAKTRVAPIKQVSIPRLELCGAVLLARLLQEVAEVLNISKDNIKAWTDSTVVLAWLNSHPSRWKTFVANRVAEILTTLDSSQWYHVSTKENPADSASRGVQPGILAENKLWFSGPPFLKEETIPYKRPQDLKVNLEESVKSHVTTLPEDTIIERFSSLQRLLRIVAYCRRFLKATERSKHLSKKEIDQALSSCIKKVQKEEFKEEYLELKRQGNVLSKKSKLKALCPYLDEAGIMRVRGRLQGAPLPESTKHPIILPHLNHFTQLIVADAHLNTLHGGTQLMVNHLRTKYWILGAKSLVKQHVRKCVTCVRQKAQVQTPFMGSLPPVRCTPARAFLHSGLDYAGPIQIRTSKGRGHQSYKGYICLFICLATKAIHLEVVSDMSTQAFLAAFRRFVSRRGNCAQLWSDNGTTFVGAAKELQQHLHVQQNEVAAYLETHGTEWHFIPPHAPNFGGLWEAGVKSTKFHLKRVIGETTLTFEEMSTLLSQVEACLNSRPITVDSSDPGEPRPLTPGHFLIGGPLLAVPEADNYLSSNVSSLSRWQHIQRMLNGFWQRWSHEYLSYMINRYKWNKQVPEIQVGDIVLIKEDNLPPSRWLLGRVINKHPGPDNVTRVVTLKVKASMIKRPVSKICKLPIDK